MKPMKYGVGQSVRRVEDAELIRGEGRYVADMVPADALRLAILRSPHAHARFSVGDLSEVRAMPGVRLVLTADDVSELGDLPCMGQVKNHKGEPMSPQLRPVLARGVARYAGEPVVAVVAETSEAARDAVEAVMVDWETLTPALGSRAASEAGAPLVHPDNGSNIAFDTVLGDQAATDAAFARAAHVARVEIVNNRLVVNYMETRGILAEYDRDTERFTLAVGSQGVHNIRDRLANDIFRLPKDRFRVITPEVGGGFGPKIFMYQEYPLALFAARALNARVAWIGDRSEQFLADAQGRDHVSVAELALDADHNFLAIRVDTLADMGAYAAQFGPMIPVLGGTMMPGTYRLPAGAGRIRGVYTNTVPVDAIRGAGRPEAAYLIERLVEAAARQLGVPSVELRARNFIRPDEMPYRTITGRNYDSGEFEGHMRRALEAADQAGFAARRAGSEARGMIRGFGIASYIEACAFGSEDSTVRLEEDGSFTVLIGTQTNGQGHRTAYAQLVSEQFDVPLERVRVVQGDSDLIATGGGTGGSRSIPVGGAAVDAGARALAEKLKALAADELEAAAGDLEIVDGRYVVAGTDRAVDIADLARSPAATAEMRTSVGQFSQPEATYPNGTHVCEVEIDPQTGIVTITAYHVVDDFGVSLNPLLLEGQIHGGIAQGVGQALMERTVYDDSGQLLSASFQDYAMPRARDFAPIAFETRNVRSLTNALGVKGAGEAGTIGSAPAAMNAVIDALHHAYGIEHLDMPATPHRVWRAIRDAGAAAS